MKKTLFIIMAIVMIVVPFGEVLGGKRVSAQENENQNEIKNLAFQEQSDIRFIYTYEENDEKYKVIENFSDDKKSVSSKIYIYDENINDYMLIDDVRTVLDEEENTVTQYSYTDQSEEKIELESISNDGEIHISNANDNIMALAAKKAPNWKYWSTSKGTNKPKRWTIAAIAITIAGITKIPATARVITNIANMTYQMNAKTIYYTKKCYIDTNSPKLRPHFKYVTDIYANSKRTKVIKKGVVSYLRP